jgi:sulfate transport system substrate-binding protein
MHILSASVLATSGAVHADVTLLNASYDVLRAFSKNDNEAFLKQWEQKTGECVRINQPHGSSSKQSRSVIDGMEGHDGGGFDHLYAI